ncbi:MAG: transporter substrate-binding domain-containing protein [Chlamydiales bacterium]|nr:transporter substrate-binding domain-containing protein [Chlamydiales bacterium]
MKLLSKFFKILGCFSLMGGTLIAKEPKQPMEIFTVGTTSGYAPYVSLDSKGQYEGFDIDLAKLVAEKLNKQLIIKDLGSMPSLMIGLKQKKVDAIIWAVSITEEREKQMEMIYYQGEKITTMPLLFWGKIPENIQGPEDLKNDPKKIVCVEAGSYQEQVMKSYPGLTLKNVDKITDAIMEIKFGKSLAIAIDNSLVSFVKQQSPELQVLYFPLPSSQQSLGNGICLTKNNPELVARVKKAVEELTNEGKIQELEKKWNMSS